MAHAYETFIEGGRRIGGTLGAGDDGPVGIAEGRRRRAARRSRPNHMHEQVASSTARIADQTVGIMTTVISQGTGRRAALGPGQFAAGKTGTTENSGDAWFVGFTKRWTVAVWVGYPDKLKPMLTEFAGAPVEGGTYPALIWHDFMVARQRHRRRAQRQGRASARACRPSRPTTRRPPPPRRRSSRPSRRPCPRAAPARRPLRRRRPRHRRERDRHGTGTGTAAAPARAPARRPKPPAQTTTPPPAGAGTGGTGTGGGTSAPPSPARRVRRRCARAAATAATRGGCRARRSASRGRRPS